MERERRRTIEERKLSPETFTGWEAAKARFHEANEAAKEAQANLQRVKAQMAQELTGLNIGDVIELLDWGGRSRQPAVVEGFYGGGHVDFGEVKVRHIKKDGTCGKHLTFIEPNGNMAWGDGTRCWGQKWKATGERHPLPLDDARGEQEADEV